MQNVKTVSALMIVTDGKVVAEWGNTASRYKTHSVRKAFLSALYGIGVAEGRIDLTSTLEELRIDDDPIPLTPAEKQATVADLLKARSGIYHPAASGWSPLPLPRVDVLLPIPRNRSSGMKRLALVPALALAFATCTAMRSKTRVYQTAVVILLQ